MPISTLQTPPKKVTEYLIYVLGIVGVGLVVFFGGEIIRNKDNFQPKSGLSVTTNNATSQVYVNDEFVGDTPFTSMTIKTGANKITVKNPDRTYETTLNFMGNDNQLVLHVGIIRDLGINDYFSSGQNFWFEKDPSNATLRIISEPTEAKVIVDGSEVGTTPFSSAALTEGEYDLQIAKDGYETQSTRINIKKDFTLNVNTKLFPQPVAANVNSFQDAKDLFEIGSTNQVLLQDTGNWAKAIYYWNKTRGISLNNSGPSKEELFDYFIDFKGNAYDKQGLKISSPSDFERIKNAKRGAYLADGTKEKGMSPEAIAIYQNISSGAVAGKKVKILETGQSWLRVRNTASLDGTEVGRVNVGETFAVLAEEAEWVKISYDTGKEGWVFKQFTQEVEATE